MSRNPLRREAAEPEGAAGASASGRWYGVTLQLGVPDFEEGVTFYTKLIGRPPDLMAHEDFAEWRIVSAARRRDPARHDPSGAVLQIAGGEARPGRPIRFQVDDIEAAREWMRNEMGVDCGPVRWREGLVAWIDFEDPGGNPLGFYQPLFARGRPPRPQGGSWTDPDDREKSLAERSRVPPSRNGSTK